MNLLTADTFFNGRIRVKQNRAGYRFSIDAVLIAGQTIPSPGNTVLDLGTGCGIIPLILAYRHPKIKVYGVEVQQQLADLATINVEENRMKDRITIHCMDMKKLKHDMMSGPVDLVVSNPPYRKSESGRINPDQQRAVARHEIKATLSDVVETAQRMLRTAGRFVTVYPAERMADILIQMRSAGLEPKSLRTVHSDRHSDAKLIIVEGKKGGRPGLKIGSPVIIYRKDGSYTDEVQEMFKP
ncbi:MAG: tRNA1(Val) (adenine(37)-N6)-methyltransferase [Desulfobacterales bacterium]